MKFASNRIDMTISAISTAALLLWIAPAASGEEGNGLLMMFWNLENLFDWKDTGGSESDTGFSSYGERHWTRKRFYRKCSTIGKTILWIGNRYGRLPDVIGFAEVENEFAVKSVVESDPLKKYGYRYIHYESPDPRGIDVAVIYRNCVLEKTGSAAVRAAAGTDLKTRDILLASFRARVGDRSQLYILVNHHPSKYGGAKASSSRRMAVMGTMARICDSLQKAGERNIISMGDFNDTPESAAFRLTDGILVNKAGPLSEKGEGSIRYRGKWELIDMFLVSGHLDESTEMEIVKVPFLLARDGSSPGKKPLRTYTGPAYSGGVSDHMPIILKVRCNN